MSTEQTKEQKLTAMKVRYTNNAMKLGEIALAKFKMHEEVMELYKQMDKLGEDRDVILKEQLELAQAYQTLAAEEAPNAVPAQS